MLGPVVLVHVIIEKRISHSEEAPSKLKFPRILL